MPITARERLHKQRERQLNSVSTVKKRGSETSSAQFAVTSSAQVRDLPFCAGKMAGEENTASDLITYNELVLLDREFIPPLRLINGVVSLVPPLTEPALLIFTQQTPHFDSNYFSVDKI